MMPLPRTEAQDRPCPICGAGASTAFFAAPDHLHGTPGSFTYRRCGRCSSVFQSPRVLDADLPKLYPAGYYTHDGDARTPWTGSRAAGLLGRLQSWVRDGVQAEVRGVRSASTPRAGALARLRWLRERAFYDLVPDELLPRVPGGSLLDVGCGSGWYMLRLQALGWRVEGSEWDVRAAGVARERTGARVQAGGIEGLSSDSGPYDLILLAHVLEHLVEPVQAVAGLSRFLAPNGRLVLVYPNPESLLARVYCEHWCHWDPPRHLVVPPAAALVGALEEVGLRRESCRTVADRPALFSAASRARGRADWRPGDQVPAPVLADRMLGAAETAVVGLGLGMGEEVILTLSKGGSARDGHAATRVPEGRAWESN